MARIAVHEKGLTDAVEVIPAQTRKADSPFYGINPSGRVPFLVRDDGTTLEESQLIVRWLDHLDGQPQFDHPDGPDGWESRWLEALARSLMDGLSVWGRELKRPEEGRYPVLIAHEKERARRLMALWEQEIAAPLMQTGFGMPHLTLICALDLDRLNPGYVWRDRHPALAAWAEALSIRPSLAATAPDAWTP